MKKIKFLSLIFTAFWLCLTFSNANAQEPTATPETQIPNQTVRPFKIFEELGLTREQIQQIRRINQTRKPIMQEAQQRWRMANRNLDLAVYADNSTDEEVKELTKTAQQAQSELLRERILTEYLIRKVLTPEQLVKFRNLREQLLQRRNNFKNQNNPNNQQQRPLNRLQQRRMQNRQP